MRVCMEEQSHHSTCMKVRKQILGVCSVLILWIVRSHTPVVGLAASTHTAEAAAGQMCCSSLPSACSVVPCLPAFLL